MLIMVRSASACASAGWPSSSKRRISGTDFRCFGIASVALIARPHGVLVQLEVLFADVAKHHGGEPAIAYRQSLRPLRGGLPVPELQSVIVLRLAQGRKAKYREHAGVQEEKRSHDRFLNGWPGPRLVDRILVRDARPIVRSERDSREPRAIEQGRLGIGLPGVADICRVGDRLDETITLSPAMRASAQCHLRSSPAIENSPSFSPFTTNPPSVCANLSRISPGRLSTDFRVGPEYTTCLW